MIDYHNIMNQFDTSNNGLIKDKIIKTFKTYVKDLVHALPSFIYIGLR